MRLTHGFLGPLLGALGGGLVSSIFGNAQNKSNQQAATNQQTGSEQFQAAQLQKMIQFIQQQQQQAFGNLSNYLKQNPMPSANLPPIALPNSSGSPSVIGGQQLDATGQLSNPLANTPEQLVNSAIPQSMPNPNANVSLLDSLMPFIQAMQQQAAPAMPPAAAPSPSAPTNFPRHGGPGLNLANRYANL